MDKEQFRDWYDALSILVGEVSAKTIVQKVFAWS